MADCVFARRRFKVAPKTETVVFYASSYTADETVKNPSNMYTGISSTTYATMKAYVMYEGATLQLKFNTSSIPNNVTIDNVIFRVKARVSTKTSVTRRSIRPRRGTTVITSYSEQQMSNTAYTYTFSGVSWTLAQIKNYTPQLYFDIDIAEGAPNDVTLYIYGAELEVIYTYN